MIEKERDFKISLFSSYLWGIETTVFVSCEIFFQLVFFLPMRNWNISTRYYGNNETKFSSYLWGIETIISIHFNHNLMPIVFILPMRNWNQNERAGKRAGKEFSSYLWGIETRMEKWTVIKWSSFHLTYEELKRDKKERFNGYGWFSSYLWGIETSEISNQKNRIIWPFSSYLWGIETGDVVFTVPWGGTTFSSYLWGIETIHLSTNYNYFLPRFHLTYEELKHEKEIVKYGLQDFGFHLTYEELKLAFSIFITSIFFVFILPMRNWNKKIYWQKFSVLIYVFILPMRNWNLQYYHWSLALSAVFILPMRNWNKSRLRESKIMRDFVFILPMRNWNQFSPASLHLLYSGFHLTYEELKLGQPHHSNQTGHCFHLTYEELKPKSGKRLFVARWKFSSYLWGIETRRVRWCGAG